MSSISSPRELVSAIASCGLLSAEELRTVQVELDGTPGDVLQTAAGLVASGRITRFQADSLLAGQAEQLVIDGRYRVRSLLGAGGMGSVYLAHDGQLDRDVAVKVLPPELIRDRDAVARFEREVKALAKLAHAAIVQAFDAGADGDRHFLVMEYVEGQNLGDRLKHGPIAAARAADYAYQAAIGLAHAHSKGLIHRDLKPANLIVTPREQVKILDLGLARFVQDQISDATLTREGIGLGTPDYMAPEQFGAAREADARSDVYSLGCTLYHMLAGRVPFPGSSLSEKARAHQVETPPALEEFCPEVPAGLSEAVYRMLAKKPAARFASAGEAAEALLPYVARSSRSLPNFRATASWTGAQWNVTKPRISRRSALWIGGGLAAGAALGFGVPMLLDGDADETAGGNEPDQSNENIAKNPGDGESKDPKDPTAPAVNTVPWLLTVAQDGSAQFKSITEALKAAQPGMTIAVLDDAEYDETLLLNRPSQHNGLTLIASRGATLVNNNASGNTVAIHDVQDLTLSGFRMTAAASGLAKTHVLLKGECHGILLDRLDIESPPSSVFNGIEIVHTPASDTLPPNVVQDSTIRGGSYGMAIAGFGADLAPIEAGGISARGNVFHDCALAVFCAGLVRRFQFVGNRIGGAMVAGVQFQDPAEGSSGIVIANNTFVDSRSSLRLWADKVVQADVTVAGNVFLDGIGPDMLCIDSGGTNAEVKGPGDVEALQKTWEFSHNWREGKQPPATDDLSKSWVPPTKTDTLLETIDGVPRNPDHADFLRPAVDSPLASGGAGQVEPSLPTYVGAVPPPGVEEFDWTRTWQAPPGTSELLTVSQDEKDGGKYRTINEALAAAKPWATVRVLDAGSYDESVSLRDARLEGVWLDAPRRATLSQIKARGILIDAAGVPFFRVSGFRLRNRSKGLFATFVQLTGDCRGAVLEDLKLVSEDQTFSMNIGVSGMHDAPPVIVRRCSVENPGEGILLAAPPGDDTRSGVRVENCRLTGIGFRALLVEGPYSRVLLAGNVIAGGYTGLQVEDLLTAPGRIVLANNTSAGNSFGFRYYANSDPPASVPAGQVEFSNNLFANNTEADVGFMRGDTGNPDAKFGNELLKKWRWHSNWRDGVGATPANMLPAAPGERQPGPPPFISEDPASADYLRPKPDSPLAKPAGGQLDPTLPSYIGAVPPAGVAAWDWDITWRSRMMWAKYAEQGQDSQG